MSGATWIYADERRCSLRAHAKLNVTLEVLGRRDDGYHDVVHVMQTLELHDIVSVSTTTDDDGIAFASTSAEIDPVENLCVAAARALRERSRITAGVRIELDKRVPIAAGLGGGSSDAAAVLLALRRLWSLPMTDADLQAVGASLGSDVPFFLAGRLALCEGRGERVTPLHARWSDSMRWLLLVKPATGVLTRDAYQGLGATAFTDGARSRSLQRRIEQGEALDARDVFNGIEESIFTRYAHVAEAREVLLGAGAPRVVLCGTGATVFAGFERLEDAVRVRARLPSLATWVTQIQDETSS